jgi:hypothetical protein
VNFDGFGDMFNEPEETIGPLIDPIQILGMRMMLTPFSGAVGLVFLGLDSTMRKWMTQINQYLW